MRQLMRGCVLVILSLLVAACSSSSGGSGGSTPCNQNPWECSSSQTCWPSSTSTFACLNAGAGKAGDACEDTVNAPTCGAGLWCLQVASGASGVCAAYCSTTDSSHACPGGQNCVTAALGGTGGPEVQVCVGTTLPGDAGTDAPSSGGDAGSDAAADAPPDAAHD